MELLNSSFLDRKDGLPIVLHAHDCPPALRRFFQCFDKLAAALGLGVVGVFAFAVGVVDDEAETRARVVDGGVLQHCMVAVAVATTDDGSATDKLMNADWLARLVVHEQMVHCLRQHRSAVAQLECRPRCRSDHLLRRDAVDALHPDAHEIRAATGNDEGLEAVRPQVAQEFLHRLEGELVIGLAVLRMFGRCEPRLHGGTELVGGHTGMGERADSQQARVASPFQEFLQVTCQGGLNHWVCGELGLSGDAALQFVDEEGELKRHRILWPERAVVVEHGDAFGRRHEVLAPSRNNALDKRLDGLPGL